MKYTLEIPEQEEAFVLEFLRRVTSVKLTPVHRKTVVKKEVDTTDYLLASPANADRLRQAYEQFDQGQRIDFTLPQE